jgi:hypothetical protein
MAQSAAKLGLEHISVVSADHLVEHGAQAGPGARPQLPRSITQQVELPGERSPLVLRQRLDPQVHRGQAGFRNVRGIRPHHVPFDQVERCRCSQQVRRVFLERLPRNLQKIDDAGRGPLIDDVGIAEVGVDRPEIAFQLHVASPELVLQEVFVTLQPGIAYMPELRAFGGGAVIPFRYGPRCRAQPFVDLIDSGRPVLVIHGTSRCASMKEGHHPADP